MEQDSRVLAMAHWGHRKGWLEAPSHEQDKPVCCGHFLSSVLGGNAEWSPCSQAAPWAFEGLPCSLSFLCEKKLILVKEEEEEGNKMAFGQE